MNDRIHMSSHRPYLLRALYEWIADNGMTPQILVDTSAPGVRVPKHIIGDGRVVLNIADRAVAKLQMDNDCVRFGARFGGMPQQVLVPVNAILAIYARETEQGMVLPPVEVGAGREQAQETTPQSARPSGLAAVSNSVPSTEPGLPDSPDDDAPSPPPAPSPSPKRNRAHLRVVK